MLGGLTALGAVLGWAAWHWRYQWWGRWRRRNRNDDPVRREAGRWLRRLALAELPADSVAVVEELERLRYGPAIGGRYPRMVFLRAKRVWRMCR